MQTLNYPFHPNRRKTRTVNIAGIPLGFGHPIRIQSMLTSHTYQPVKCVAEMKSLIDAGCEFIRLTIPSGRDIDAMPEIRRMMREEGITVPLVADIHFAPHLAVDACEFFEKVRINPGNFSDRPKNSSERSKQHFDFEEGRGKLNDRILKLSVALKKYGRALRIGVNQGSLSSRMIQEYGDSPMGMVKSALEAIELFEAAGIRDIVVSLKSSNPFVVQKAYRLFCEYSCGKDAVPLHLGVTEAGDGDMARCKSISGIGALLHDGIGDTIRVSLTEPSANEVVFAHKLVAHIQKDHERLSVKSGAADISEDLAQKSFEVNLDQTRIGNPIVESDDLIFGGTKPVLLGTEEDIPDLESDFRYTTDSQGLPIYKGMALSPEAGFRIFDSDSGKFEVRNYYRQRSQNEAVGFRADFECNSDDFTPEITLGSLIGEGLIDFILIPAGMPKAMILRLRSILQATRVKLSETDYISCPSCGRTNFDLTSVTAGIKERTRHLKGVKIGIMGCIVNGPGEMADADFGYVGSGNGKIDLYLGHNRVERGIPESQAVEALIDLIKSENRWQEPA